MTLPVGQAAISSTQRPLSAIGSAGWALRHSSLFSAARQLASSPGSEMGVSTDSAMHSTEVFGRHDPSSDPSAPRTALGAVGCSRAQSSSLAAALHSPSSPTGLSASTSRHSMLVYGARQLLPPGEFASYIGPGESKPSRAAAASRVLQFSLGFPEEPSGTGTHLEGDGEMLGCLRR